MCGSRIHRDSNSAIAQAILFHFSFNPARGKPAVPKASPPSYRQLPTYRQPVIPYRMSAYWRRRLLATTLTELNAMAALARIGLSRSPKAG